ncbi:hypothetical protein Tco_1084374, partial [Tanacetum coccineum]
PALPSPKSIKIQELSNQVLLLQSQTIKLKNEKAAAEVEAAFLKVVRIGVLPRIIFGFVRLRGLKQYVEGLEIEITGDLKDIHEKLEKFQSVVSAITKQVAELKNLKLELPAELLALPKQVSSINAQLLKLKVLDDITSLLKKVTRAFDRFAQAIESA